LSPARRPLPRLLPAAALLMLAACGGGDYVPSNVDGEQFELSRADSGKSAPANWGVARR